MSQNGLPIVDFLSHLFIVRQWGKKWISKKKRFVSSPSVTKIKGCYPSLYRSGIGSHFVGRNLVVWKEIVVSLAPLVFQTGSCFTGGCVCRCKDIDCLLVGFVCIKRKLV